MLRQNWDEIPKEHPLADVSRQMLHTQNMTILRVELQRGAFFPMHQHVHEQVTMLLSGALRVEVGGEQILLRAGDVLQIPSNVPHSVEALEDSLGTELFTPVREDWKKQS